MARDCGKGSRSFSVLAVQKIKSKGTRFTKGPPRTSGEVPVNKEALFQPIRIGNVEIKSRAVMTTMCTCYQDGRGHVTDQSKAFHNARTKGGARLLIAGSVTATKRHADRRGNSGFKMLDAMTARWYVCLSAIGTW